MFSFSINHCLTKPELPLTNGQQILTGSCNGVIMGEIPAKTKMPSTRVVFPAPGQKIPEGTDINFQVKLKNCDSGFFTNAQKNYFSAPQQVDGSGTIIGHSHITVDPIANFQDTKPTDPEQFKFFKGLNDKAVNGELNAEVFGLKAGFYRMSTINSAANHQPVLAPVAQHGSSDDAVYVSIFYVIHYVAQG